MIGSGRRRSFGIPTALCGSIIEAAKAELADRPESFLTITAGSIVDAAHIHQFANSRNNDPRNGLALCKNAHWLFDNGLWTLADDYTVIVAISRFSETSLDHKSLSAYHGEKIRLPSDRTLLPNPIHLAWHRKFKFQGV
jgi:putative restriction endonuclease